MYPLLETIFFIAEMKTTNERMEIISRQGVNRVLICLLLRNLWRFFFIWGTESERRELPLHYLWAKSEDLELSSLRDTHISSLCFCFPYSFHFRNISLKSPQSRWLISNTNQSKAIFLVSSLLWRQNKSFLICCVWLLVN